MKKAKIVAAIVLAAAVGTTAFVAACGNDDKGGHTKQGKEFNLADYAHALDSAYAEDHLTDYSANNVREGYSKATKKNYKYMSYLSGNFLDVTVESGSSLSHTFYDLKNDKELFSGYYSINSDNYYGGYYNVYYYILVKEKNDGYEYSYVGPDGKLLTSYKFAREYYSHYPDDLYWSVRNSYTDENNNRVEIYSISYYDTTKNEGVVKYFSYSKEDNKMVWKEVSEDAINAPEKDSEYSAGTQLGLIKEELADSDYYPGSNWDGIEYTVEGNLAETYTYYKKGTKISSLSLGVNAEVICYVGNYVYYSETVPVSADATDGYNYEMIVNNVTTKGNYTLYRYDFINGAKAAEEVKTDYIVVSEATQLYNYASKSFDKVAVSAIKKENGIAIVNALSSYYSLILDDDFNLSADVSGKSVSSAKVYKLKDNRYLAGSSIVDGDLNIVAQLPGSATVWAEKNLIVTYVSGAGTMLVDYDGKVVIEPSSGSLTFYGDVAYNSNTGKLYSKSNPSGIELDKVVTVDATKGETVEWGNGVLVKTAYKEITSSDSYVSGTYTYTIYDLTGKSLLTISNASLSGSINVNPIGGKLLVSAYVHTDINSSSNSETNYWVIG